ncbi:RNA-binding protein with multiple splicing 2-like isoform X2 [Oscarella lobularis]|uniref:RNA-binding protein with multiple splicing 2-like isoform X2 n=1 Tax=Oscarella lobularis TaxID=121494 RepID=UPI003313D5CD
MVLDMDSDHEKDKEGVAQGAQAADEEVRTLFVSGLPPDVRPRELYLLFRPYKDYEGSQIRWATKRKMMPVAFVVFRTRAGADEARVALQGEQFDPDLPLKLRLEFAKTNTKSAVNKMAPSYPFRPVNAATAAAAAAAAAAAQYPPGTAYVNSYVGPAMQEGWAHPQQMFPMNESAVMQQAALTQLPMQMGPPVPSGPHHHHHHSQQATSTPPGPVLFVANINPALSEKDIHAQFQCLDGYARAQVVPPNYKGGVPACYIEFHDAEKAGKAIPELRAANRSVEETTGALSGLNI